MFGVCIFVFVHLVVTIECISFGRRWEGVSKEYLNEDGTHAPPLDDPRTPILHPPSTPPKHCHEKYHDHRMHPKNKHLYEDASEDASDELSEEITIYREGKKNNADNSERTKNKHYENSKYDGASDDTKNYYKNNDNAYNTRYEDDGYNYDNPKYDYNYDADTENKRYQDEKGRYSKNRSGKAIKEQNRSPRKMKFATNDYNDFHGVVNKSGNGLHLFRVRQGETNQEHRFS